MRARATGVAAAACVALLLGLLLGCARREPGPTASGKPPVPALDIRPNTATITRGTTFRFRAYLVEGQSTSLIDPSQVKWSVSRERGQPGRIDDGLFVAPDDTLDATVTVRAVFRAKEYAGSTSDAVMVRIVRPKSDERDRLEPGETPPDKPSVVGQRVFDTSNAHQVRSNPPLPAAFSLTEPRKIVYIVTYHWNGGRGAPPGTIALERTDGKRYGPWEARGQPGREGTRPNVYWVVFPDEEVPAGRYKVVDSSPETWSHNAFSGGRGMCIVEAAE